MPPGQSHTYYGFEVNAGGEALAYRVDVEDFAETGAMDWSWGGDGSSVCATRCVPASGDLTMAVVVGVPWEAMQCRGMAEGTMLRVQTNRNHVGASEVLSMSEHAKRTGVGAGDDAAAAAAEAAVWSSTPYSASTDAGDGEVNFHRPEMFCEAVLL